jgi:uncharacterized protein (DUF362 family)
MFSLSQVAVLKYKNNLVECIRRGINLVEKFKGLPSPILIKPNICTISDNTGYSVTNVAVIESLVKIIIEYNDALTIKIVESDSQSKYVNDAFEKFGYTSMVESMVNRGYDVQLINLSNSTMQEYRYQGRYFKNPKLPIELTEDHYYISVAVPKTHYLTQITGSLKNQFGLLPRKDQAAYHPNIDDVIVDINSIVRPNLCIFDARVGVERWNGPKTHPMGLFVIGNNVVSTDAIMSHIMGFDPKSINHIRLANESGLGGLDPEVIGENPDDVVVKFRQPK